MEVSFSLNTDLCYCEKPKTCDPYRKHIVTEDFRITETESLESFQPRGLITENLEV